VCEALAPTLSPSARLSPSLSLFRTVCLLVVGIFVAFICVVAPGKQKVGGSGCSRGVCWVWGALTFRRRSSSSP